MCVCVCGTGEVYMPAIYWAYKQHNMFDSSLCSCLKEQNRIPKETADAGRPSSSLHKGSRYLIIKEFAPKARICQHPPTTL